ncbi:MAG: heparinase II/III family protein [Ignavibacteriales bacterium]|nr:heparinase II/III family protein [Ignavibacteriales bacterium]
MSDAGMQYVAPAFAAERADTIVLITFDATSYPLEEHCRYAVHSDADRPYTFPNFTFQQQPPGLRVGPWPGWRGIPPMPLTTLKSGERVHELQFQFWGDELARHVLRAVVKISSFRSEQIVVSMTDPRLVPLEAQFYAVRPLKPAPFVFEVPAEKLHRHPRLLINQSDISALKQNQTVARRESLRRIHEFIPMWDRSLVVTPESKIPDGPESLTPEDRVLIGAFLALIEPSSANIERAIKSLLDYCALTEQPGFAPLTIDTQSGETLFLLSVGYDWLFHHLSADDEQRIRKRLWEIADICWNHLGYEREDYSQAHYLGCGMGLLAFSLLFQDTHPRAREWSNHLAGVARLVLSMLPADGFFPHGINLWIYEFGFLLRWLELLRSGGGPEIWPHSAVMINASAFRAAATSPDGLHGVTFGDPQYRVGGDSWCHYLIAARTGSGEARWLGDVLLELPVKGVDFRNAPARRRVYECLWFPDHVEPVHTREGTKAFPDGAQIFVRTSDSLFTFRSGPPLGKHRYEAGITGGYGHSDPCNGSFLLHQNNSMLIGGPGPVYRRDTSLHNIITINGTGQIGDSAVWMPDFVPPSLHAPLADIRTSGSTVAATVELAHSYLPHLGVQSLRRSICVQPGRYIFGADVVTLANAASIEWNLHSCEEFSQFGGGQVVNFKIGTGSNGPNAVVSFSSEKVTWKTGLTGFVPAYPNSGERDRVLCISCENKNAFILWCICMNGNPPELQFQTGNRATWKFPDGTAAEFDGTWISLRGTP